VNYLGDEMPTYTLNFSRGSAMILAQYYNLLRFGREGYTRFAMTLLGNARYLAKRLADSGRFEMLNAANLLPIVTAKLKEPVMNACEILEGTKTRGIIPRRSVREGHHVT
jgi:glutamate decarboxylase